MPQTLYRIVASNPPSRRDFVSHAELGKIPPNPTPELLERWQATSMFDDSELARALARQRPHLGR